MTTNVSVSPDSYASPEAVVGIYALYQAAPAHPVMTGKGTVEAADDDDEEAKAVVEAKVVKSPPKPAAKATDSGVEAK